MSNPVKNPDKFVPVGVIDCRLCKWPSLSWNMVCVRCGEDLMPDEHMDDQDVHVHGRHTQESAA